jgi:hypothetical protein
MEYPNNSGARIFARMEPQRVPNDQDPEPAVQRNEAANRFASPTSRNYNMH